MCSKNILTGLVALFATFSLGVLASLPFAPFSAPDVTVVEPVSAGDAKIRKCRTEKHFENLTLDPAKQEVIHLTTGEEAEAIRQAERQAKRDRQTKDAKR